MVAPWAQLDGVALVPVWLAAEKQAEPLLTRLDPATRAKVLMALLGLVLVGLSLVALAWLGGRRLRQVASKSLPPTQPNEDRWYRKPLVPPEIEHRGDDST
jgi:hypothetical protein